MSITLTPAELVAVTGYSRPCAQLRVLHERGFVRAFIGRTGVILERVHYEAVCRGQHGQDTRQRPAANLGFLRRAS